VLCGGGGVVGGCWVGLFGGGWGGGLGRETGRIERIAEGGRKRGRRGKRATRGVGMKMVRGC